MSTVLCIRGLLLRGVERLFYRYGQALICVQFEGFCLPAERLYGIFSRSYRLTDVHGVVHNGEHCLELSLVVIDPSDSKLNYPSEPFDEIGRQFPFVYEQVVTIGLT